MSPPTIPRVSILIPNYNNGVVSSQSGQLDFIANLLQSLHDTLKDDPTPFEVIAYDDGSTDDSLETLRTWSNKTWPSGQPFLELIEAPHCGVLAKTANVLSRQARGDILVRLDGDIVCLTPNWVTLLCEVFDHGPPRLGVVGPKQLLPDGRIHAMGDWVLHPQGYTHIAHGLDRYAARHAIEVDHVMGCFYCCKKAVFEELDGYDEKFLRGQTIDFGLRARLKGWSCIAVPHIEFVHYHALRKSRSTEADSRQGVNQSMKVFQDKWGFDRVAPDLDAVRDRYKGTPLLWNARWFGTPDPYLAQTAATQPVDIATSDWSRYSNDEAFRKQFEFRAMVALDVARQTGQPGCVAVIGSGVGLMPHLLAINGLSSIGIEPSKILHDFAQKCTDTQKYEAGSAGFLHQSDPKRLPLDDGQADLLLVYDLLERHPNPVGLLREARRVLAADKPMVIISRRLPPSLPQATDAEHRYTWLQLVRQVQAVGGWGLMMDPNKDDPARDMVLIVKRLAQAQTDGSDRSIPAAAKGSSPLSQRACA